MSNHMSNSTEPLKDIGNKTDDNRQYPEILPITLKTALTHRISRCPKNYNAPLKRKRPNSHLSKSNRNAKRINSSVTTFIKAPPLIKSQTVLKPKHFLPQLKIVKNRQIHYKDHSQQIEDYQKLVSKLEAKIKNMKNEKSDMKKKVEELENANEVFGQENKILDDKNVQLQKGIENLRTDVAEIQMINEEIEEKSQNVQLDMKKIEGENSDLKDKNSKFDANNVKLQHEISRLQETNKNILAESEKFHELSVNFAVENLRLTQQILEKDMKIEELNLMVQKTIEESKSSSVFNSTNGKNQPSIHVNILFKN